MIFHSSAPRSSQWETSEFGRAFAKAGGVRASGCNTSASTNPNSTGASRTPEKMDGWTVRAGPEDPSPRLEAADPRYIFILVQKTVSEDFNNIGLWLAPMFGGTKETAEVVNTDEKGAAVVVDTGEERGR